MDAHPDAWRVLRGKFAALLRESAALRGASDEWIDATAGTLTAIAADHYESAKREEA